MIHISILHRYSDWSEILLTVGLFNKFNVYGNQFNLEDMIFGKYFIFIHAICLVFTQ